MCAAIAGSFHIENVDESYTDQYDYKKPKSTDAFFLCKRKTNVFFL